MGKYSVWNRFDRKVTNEEVFGITTPLITTSSGKKWAKPKMEQYGYQKIN